MDNTHILEELELLRGILNLAPDEEVPSELTQLVSDAQKMMHSVGLTGRIEPFGLVLLALQTGNVRKRKTVKNAFRKVKKNTRVKWQDKYRETWGLFQFVCEPPRDSYCRVIELGDHSAPRDIEEHRLTIAEDAEPPEARPVDEDLPFNPGQRVIVGEEQGYFRAVSPTGRIRVELNRVGLTTLESFDLEEVRAFDADTDAADEPKGWGTVQPGHPCQFVTKEGELEDAVFLRTDEEGTVCLRVIDTDAEIVVDTDDVVLDSLVTIDD